MEVLTLAEEQLHKLDKYHVDSGVSNSESQIFYFNQGNKEYLFKYLNIFNIILLLSK